jgi:hypothetical protein
MLACVSSRAHGGHGRPGGLVGMTWSVRFRTRVAWDREARSPAVDAAYLTGRTYYLVPDGTIGQKPYARGSGAAQFAGSCTIKPTA